MRRSDNCTVALGLSAVGASLLANVREQARSYIGVALLAVVATPGHADPAAGEQVFTGNKCNDCHYTQGPAREKTIADQLAKKGPELWYAGSKFQKPWLEGWLQDPQPIRPLKYNSLSEDNPGDHPKLAAADAGAVTEFMMSLTSIATSTMLFGLSSGAALATVVGVLIEVPLMLILVRFCLKTQHWFGKNEKVNARKEC
jgi:hypothetical protein